MGVRVTAERVLVGSIAERGEFCQRGAEIFEDLFILFWGIMSQEAFLVMLLLRNSLLLLFPAAVISTVAAAQTLQTLETYKGSDPTTCTAPPMTTSFLSSDTSVNAYISLTAMNQNGGDQ